MSFDEYELAVVRKAMGRGNGCCERDAAKGLDGVSVELSVGWKSVHRYLFMEEEPLRL